MSRPVVIVAGPTASGKSALALDMAVEFSGTVINADSMQVYRELRILTARPSADDEARAPHRLFGILAATERCSAGRWLKLAVAEIETAWAEGRLPIVVGGTGLYLKALMEGLSTLPPVPEAARLSAVDLHRRLGGEGLRLELARLDPAAAARLRPSDTQRLVRAYAVAAATGKSLSQWQAENRPHPPLDARFFVLALLPPREELYAEIEARFDRMIEAGALGEIEAMEKLPLDPSLPAARALGVAELGRALRGETSLETALREAKRKSRHYAKRQLTWLRTQIVISEAVTEKYSQSLCIKIFPLIRNFLLTTKFL